MAHRITILILLLMFMTQYSCWRPNVYNHSAETIELGNGYYYLADGKESQILLNLKPESKSKFGKTIIPPEVIQYNYDDNFIIAQTLEKVNVKELLKYWIVEKVNKDIDAVIPLDSLSFYKNIDILGIKIKLKPR